jgi:transcription elongation factor GreA
VQSEATNRVLLTATGRRLLERRIAGLDRTVAELRTTIDDPESRPEGVAEYLRTMRELDRLRAVLRHSEVVEDAFADDPTVVEVGDRVIIRREDGVAERYILVHPDEAAVDSERISTESPLGRALLSRRVGETVSVVAPGMSYSCRILTATRPHA